MSVPPESPLDLSNTYGAVFVGVVLSWFLAGVSTIQTVQYFHKYGDDSRFLKLTVGSLWIWTIASGIVITTPVWTRAIMHWGDSATLATCPSALIHATWMSVFVGVAVQLFFIHRIWLLSRKRYWHICTVLMALALYQQGAIVAYGVIILQQRDIYILSRTITIINGLAISVRGCMLVADILIAASLMRLILRAGVPRWSMTRRRVDRLLFLTFNTGVWTAALGIAFSVLYTAFPATLWSSICTAVLAPVYFSTLLANLNARRCIRDTVGENEYLGGDLDLPSLGSDGRANSHLLVLGSLSSASQSQASKPLEVSIEKTTATYE